MAIAENSVNTDRKLPAYLFQPGDDSRRNTRGRPKGSKNEFSMDFVRALQKDFNEYGEFAIQQVRQEKPDAYLKVIASLMPKDINLNVNKFDELSDNELRARLEQLQRTIGPMLDAVRTGGGDSGGADAPGTDESVRYVVSE